MVAKALVCALLTLSVTFAQAELKELESAIPQPSQKERFFFGGGGGRSSDHPLNPLSEAEIRTTTNIINNFRRGSWLFTGIALKEPLKSLLLPSFLTNSRPPTNIPRRSASLIVELDAQKIYEVIVNLNTRRVESWTEAPIGARPLLTSDVGELLGEKIAKENRTVQDRCRELGWTNMSYVGAEPWPINYVEDRPEYKGKWIYPLYMYGRHNDWDNQMAHPFDFLVIVDLVKRQVVNIEELPIQSDFNTANKEGNSIPQKEANYDPALRDRNSYRRDLKPVSVTQDGTSFTMSGNELQWQKFKMRIGFNYREGLVIYNVNYNDNGTVRPLFYRLSVAELFIPYGDARPPYHRKYVFDEGQYGLGFITNPLVAGRDCVGEVKLVDGVVSNGKGEPRKIPGAVCIREEDAGILWKHTDFRTGRSSIVRSQRLALTFIATIGNYDYIFSWNFYLDGRIESNVKLTGIPSANLMAVGANPAGHGTSVYPQINAQHHQHFFTIRADAEIDGNKNSVALVDVIPGPGETGTASNPYGNGFTTSKTVLKTASEGRTNIDPFKSRSWHIQNPENKHIYTKQPVTWKLEPFASAPVLRQKSSPMHPTSAYTDYNTWVTPYQEDQFFPGGTYLNNSGLPEWVGQNPEASIENTDIVLWHTYGISHIVRAEDWPIMPEESCGIVLKPYSFFNENPSLDVPPPANRRSNMEL